MIIMLTIIMMSIIHIVYKEKAENRLPQKYNVEIVINQNKDAKYTKRGIKT